MAQHVEHRQPRSEDASSAIADWIVRIRAHRELLRRIGVGVSVLIISVSTFIFGHTLISIDPRNFEAAFAATGADQIAMAFGFTTLSYIALTGYDGLALRHLHARVPYRLTALASFTSYAISFTLGFPLVTAGAVRYWLYSSAGLSAGKVASLTVVAGVTFWLGMGLVLALGFIVDAVEIGEINHLASWANQAIGLGMFGVLSTYLVWVTRMRRQGKGVFLNFKLPGLMLTLGQTGLGAIDVCWRRARYSYCCPKATRSVTWRSVRSIRLRRCSASQATRRAGSECSRRRCSRASAGRANNCSRRFCYFAPSTISFPSCLRSRCWAPTRRCAAGAVCARRWRRRHSTAKTNRTVASP